jgi:hypothetical protein
MCLTKGSFGDLNVDRGFLVIDLSSSSSSFLFLGFLHILKLLFFFSSLLNLADLQFPSALWLALKRLSPLE